MKAMTHVMFVSGWENARLATSKNLLTGNLAGCVKVRVFVLFVRGREGFPSNIKIDSHLDAQESL